MGLMPAPNGGALKRSSETWMRAMSFGLVQVGSWCETFALWRCPDPCLRRCPLLRRSQREVNVQVVALCPRGFLGPLVHCPVARTVSSPVAQLPQLGDLRFAPCSDSPG